MANASLHPALQALAHDAERAGSAMGCRYLSSDEYENALIAERRRAGAYGIPLWRQTRPWIACIIAGAAALIALPLVW
jgi:hypothetical protein